MFTTYELDIRTTLKSHNRMMNLMIGYLCSNKIHRILITNQTQIPTIHLVQPPPISRHLHLNLYVILLEPEIQWIHTPRLDDLKMEECSNCIIEVLKIVMICVYV